MKISDIKPNTVYASRQGRYGKTEFMKTTGNPVVDVESKGYKVRTVKKIEVYAVHYRSGRVHESLNYRLEVPAAFVREVGTTEDFREEATQRDVSHTEKLALADAKQARIDHAIKVLEDYSGVKARARSFARTGAITVEVETEDFYILLGKMGIHV